MRCRSADVIRVIDGPLANVRGQRPEELGYHGAAAALQEVWIALRASERQILELVTVADVATGKLPKRVRDARRRPARLGLSIRPLTGVTGDPRCGRRG